MGHLLHDHPGLLFVAATLLPLVSFLVLLLAGALRAFARTARTTSNAAETLFQALGGDEPRRVGAFIATGAIGLAFILSAIGFFVHLHDTGSAHGHDAAHAAAHEEEEDEDHPASFRHSNPRWSGSIEWARVGFQKNDKRPATVLELGYNVDNLTTIMFLMVTFIATLIHVFSMGYMADELAPETEDHQVHTADGHLHRRGRYGRFFMFLSLFCFSMLNLVLADNLFQIFISWELVGICSYLLIGFYYERHSASTAANKAFIVNRVGDAGFILGLLIIWTYIGSFNFEDIFGRLRAPLSDTHGAAVAVGGHFVRGNLVEDEDKKAKTRTVELAADGNTVVLLPAHLHAKNIAPEKTIKGDPPRTVPNQIVAANDPEKTETGWMPYWLLVAAGLGVFLGCVGKSAQFPIQVWLPDAMEGPTPVSALIHAATMVAAGVYLVGRVYPLFTPESRLVIAYTGAITLFVAATVAIVMTDIKKVLAYSTVSQLGFMMLALGVGGWIAGLFHLLTHAFFKALLFLGSGSVIYGCHHEQDMGRMGGLRKKMPITAWTMLAGVLAIAGTPLFSGWYSKDAIIASALGFAYVHPEHLLLLLLPLITAGITVFYMFRMWYLTFAGKPRDHHIHEHAHESPRLMTVPLIVLAVCALGVAWGWRFWDPEGSAMEAHLHHAQHASIPAEFGPIGEERAILSKAVDVMERYQAHRFHGLAGGLALLAALLGFVFATMIYAFRKLDPAEAKAQFPAVHRFLWHKWYFDEAYGLLVVRPALTVAGWCRAFDTYVIDGFVNFLGRFTIWVARWDGRFDNGVVDGSVNLLARVTQSTGGWLRGAQTGNLRSYIVFLVLAAICLYAVLAYFVNLAAAG
jgi:NADH-quinone oxidoreductase subunit L